MEEAVSVRRDEADEAATVAENNARHQMSDKEAAYMRGRAEPVTSSVLISSSKYLNDPFYRETYAQFALRKPGPDLPATYLIPNMVKALSSQRDDQEYYALVQEERKTKPEFDAWLKRRRLSRYIPDEMRQYGPGTLGAMIRDWIEQSGMEINFMKAGMEPRNDLEYMAKRRVSHHDIEHMVTGFGPSALGEQALAVMNNVCTLAYFSAPLAKYINEATMFVTTTSLYRLHLHTTELMAESYDAWRQGIAAGQSIKKPLLLVDWEDYLDWQVEDIAADLGFERGPGEGWAYSNEVVGAGGY
ncbi:Coq4 family protein [Sphingomonas crocodyli]|uniref:Ubiquinone biosynthesis protein n=1 Tax=Sphingomonas crocodyli TaxID=1979270 RepID=A0A437M0M9_9SPHN|nr:Coq4 family protein [Sphingomonas crocodyli]RVT91162.1 hypothetical protein EOD43_16735 [Sphingomonas crocodyli]